MLIESKKVMGFKAADRSNSGHGILGGCLIIQGSQDLRGLIDRTVVSRRIAHAQF